MFLQRKKQQQLIAKFEISLGQLRTHRRIDGEMPCYFDGETVCTPEGHLSMISPLKLRDTDGV